MRYWLAINFMRKTIKNQCVELWCFISMLRVIWLKLVCIAEQFKFRIRLKKEFVRLCLWVIIAIYWTVVIKMMVVRVVLWRIWRKSMDGLILLHHHLHHTILPLPILLHLHLHLHSLFTQRTHRINSTITSATITNKIATITTKIDGLIKPTQYNLHLDLNKKQITLH